MLNNYHLCIFIVSFYLFVYIYVCTYLLIDLLILNFSF